MDGDMFLGVLAIASGTAGGWFLAQMITWLGTGDYPDQLVPGWYNLLLAVVCWGFALVVVSLLSFPLAHVAVVGALVLGGGLVVSAFTNLDR